MRSTVEKPTETFEEAVEAHHRAVYRYAMRMTGEPSWAEDALQDTFVQAMRAWPTFRGDASVKTWLFTIARNTVARHCRRRAKEPSSFEAVESVEALGLEAGWGDEMNPESLAIQAEDRACLTRALHGLSNEDREVLLLRDVEGFTGNEAAELLGVGLRALKSRLHRARLRLAAALREELRNG